MNTRTPRRALAEVQRAMGEPLSVAALLRAVREDEELSQSEMARRLCVSRAFLCDVEKGRRQLSPTKAAAFATTLGESPTQLVRLAIQDSLRHAGLPYTVEVHAA